MMLRAPIRPSKKNPWTLIAYFAFFIYAYALLFSFVFLSKYYFQ